MSTDALTPIDADVPADADTDVPEVITVVPAVVYTPAATYIPARSVWERYSITSMTLLRWLKKLDFPPPLRVGRQRYWKVSDLETWEARHTRRSAREDGEGDA